MLLLVLLIHLKSLCCPGKHQSGGAGTTWVLGAADFPSLTSSVVSHNTDSLTTRCYNYCLCWVAHFHFGFCIFLCWHFLYWITDALGTLILPAISTPLMCFTNLAAVFLSSPNQSYAAVSLHSCPCKQLHPWDGQRLVARFREKSLQRK